MSTCRFGDAQCAYSQPPWLTNLSVQNQLHWSYIRNISTIERAGKLFRRNQLYWSTFLLPIILLWFMLSFYKHIHWALIGKQYKVKLEIILLFIYYWESIVTHNYINEGREEQMWPKTMTWIDRCAKMQATWR